jgi:hypothetical protein
VKGGKGGGEKREERNEQHGPVQSAHTAHSLEISAPDFSDCPAIRSKSTWRCEVWNTGLRLTQLGIRPFYSFAVQLATHPSSSCGYSCTLL